ncbi:hypothetical protein N7453_007879 [Penicillium expansum]|nr:hypothetical protein N7453_007879 [Penicillium expansum]
MQFLAPAAVSGRTIVVAAYEAKFARIEDLGGGVPSGLIGSPGLPETYVHTHLMESRQGVSAFASFLIDFGVWSICVPKLYDGRDAL